MTSFFLVIAISLSVSKVTDALPLQSQEYKDEINAGATIEDRLAVIENKRSPIEFVFAFDANGGKLRYKQFLKRKWSEWQNLGSPDGRTVMSNPTAVHDSNNQTSVFCVCDDGQVYSLKQDSDKVVEFGKWQQVSSKLPFQSGVTLRGKDTISAVNYQSKLTVFSRSVTNSSRLYWTQENNGAWSDWIMIGGASVSLKSDAAVAYNGFSKYLEAFAVMENNKMYRTWQTDPSTWVSWDETGYGAPKTQHAPVVHSMSDSVFNGVLNVFIYGDDGYVHHIWQTTCDKVPNPWGWCTWSVWYKISTQIPPTVDSSNPLSIGANIHLGIEVFTTGKEGGLWHMWQLERHGVWNSWEFVGRPASGAMASHPAIMNDDKGWWAAFALSTEDEVEVIEQNRSLSLSASTAPFGSPVKVSWTVPVDEATNKDWIGIYPSGADNNMYVDFYYVGGGQNPLDKAIPKGSLTFKSYLPNGKYDYRYLVNKRFFDAVQSSLTVFNGTTDKEWVQVYRGIAAGLGKEGFDFEKCVEDGNHTVVLFKESFAAFQNNDIFKGMELFGTALMDVVKAFKDCGETDIAKALEKLAMDFIKCTEGNCVNFAIDAIDEVLILFENIYEIYGDIQGASNSFKVNAYEQGGYGIGRVVAVCIAIPSSY